MVSKFSENFKLLRKSKSYSQAELAELLGISKSSVNMYERGEREPNSEMLIKIADLFEVSIDFLIGRVVEGMTSLACGICVFRAATKESLDRLTENLVPGEYWIAYSAPGVLITVDNDSSASDKDISRIVDQYRRNSEQKNKAPLENKERIVSNEALKVALWGDYPGIDDKDLEDVLMYASFIKYRKSKIIPPT